MSVEFLDLDKTIKFVPKSKGNDKSKTPLVFELKPLTWFDAITVTSLVQKTGEGSNGKSIYSINIDDRDRWFNFMANIISLIDNGGVSMPILPETVERIPFDISMELISEIMKLTKGVSGKQEKK